MHIRFPLRCGLFAALLAAVTLAAQEPREDVAPARITGTVIASGAGGPIAGGEIHYQRYDHGVAGADTQLQSNENGRFETADLKPGLYHFNVSARGYLEKWFTVDVTAGERQVVHFDLPRLASFEGRVVDGEGRPRPGIPIQVLHYQYEGFANRVVEVVRVTHTDDRGMYRAHGIAPGRYYVLAGMKPFLFAGPPNANANAVPVDDVAPVFYPDTPAIEPDSPERSRASAINLTSGDDVQGIDFVLRRFQARAIRGRVVAASGRLPGDCLQLGAVSVDGAWLAVDARFNYAEETGEFEARNVEPGAYRLSCGGTEIETPVLVGEKDVEGLVVLAARSVSIRGHLTLEGPGNDRIDQGLLIRLDGRTSGNTVLSKPVKDGNFTIDNVMPGEYRVSVSCSVVPCGGIYLKAARFGGFDPAGGSISVLPTGDSLLDVTVSSNGGRPRGTVLDERLRPVPYAEVIFMPRLQPDRSDLYRHVSATESGEFSFDNVVPGDYKAFAWKRDENQLYFDPVFVQEHAREGTEIHVNEGANGSITLRVLP